MKEKIHNWIKGLTWEDYTLVGVIIIYLVVNFMLLAPLKQLPSPIYGGDYYNHLGGMEHLAQGGSLFTNGQMLGEMPWVPWLYHLLVVVFSKITSLSVLDSILYFSPVAMLVSFITIYILTNKILHNKIFGILAVIGVAINFPLFKYSPFAYLVVIPLFLLAAYYFLKEKGWKSGIILGLMYGISGLSNTGTFIGTTFFMGFLLLYFIFEPFIRKEHLHMDKAARKKMLINNIIKAVAVFLIGFLIALLWWYQPIFVYHANTVNDMEIYGFPETITFGQITARTVASISRWFFDPANYFSLIFTVGTLLGLIATLLVKSKKEEHYLLLILFLTCIVITLTMYVTVPIAHTNLAPEITVQALMTVAAFIFFLLFIKILIQYVTKGSKIAEWSILIIVAIFFLTNYIIVTNNVLQTQWMVVGRSELPTYLTDARDWMLKNTQLNDVFITTNEDGFAINALTGRKMLTYRRTHASPYTDMNQRMLDTGLILYSNNDSVRNALLKKYQVKYLYWEPQWVNMEFHFDDKGQLQGFFDPLDMDYTPEREQTLKDNNVTYMHVSWYLDPAWQPSFPKRDLLVILPSRFDYKNPWNEKFEKYLKLDKELKYQNESFTKIYEIKQP